jgi:hypothetical protein
MIEHITLGVSLALNLLLIGPAMLQIYEFWLAKDL